MKLLIAGAGGHGRVVADLASVDGSWSEGAVTSIAFLDDRHPALERMQDWPVIGRITDLGSLASGFDGCIAAIGDAALRLSIHRDARALQLLTPVLVHPRATISRRAVLGAGTVVIAGAVVNSGATLGESCIVNTAATVDHDCVLADGVHVCPGAHLAGDVRVGSRSWIGIGATVKQGIRIGADVLVGAGAVCIADIPDGSRVAGNPARDIPR